METGSRLRRPRLVYIEYLETRIAPATFVVTSLNDSGVGSLRDAVEKANTAPGADTIIFRGTAAAGEIALTSGDIDITDSVTIKGSGAGKLIIDAQNLSRIFNIDDGTDTVKSITISGLSMVGGNSGAGNPGGGIFSAESLTVQRSVVSGCVAAPAGSLSRGGGGLYISTEGKLIIQNSSITNNTARSGGGVAAFVEGDIRIINTLISGNVAETGAGGLFLDVSGNGTGDILVSGSTITGNSVTASGGVGGGMIANNSPTPGGAEVGQIVIRNSIISGNACTSEAGGFRLGAGNTLIERSVISNNTAVYSGGGFSTDLTKSVIIRSSQLINNQTTSSTALGGGGAFFRGDESIINIQGTLISGNRSANYGGGILTSGSQVTVQTSTISGNTAADAGGGIYATDGKLTIDKSTIRDNQSIGRGGGVFTGGYGDNKLDLLITRSLFHGNRALSGGAVDTFGDGAITLSSSQFIRNTAILDGGGLYLRSGAGAISIRSSLIAQNTAADDGGGLALQGPVVMTITSTRIMNNLAASDDGGGIVLYSGSLTLRNSTVSGNIAADSGGGIWSLAITPLFENTKVEGNTAPEGAQNAAEFP